MRVQNPCVMCGVLALLIVSAGKMIHSNVVTPARIQKFQSRGAGVASILERARINLGFLSWGGIGFVVFFYSLGGSCSLVPSCGKK